MIDSDYLSLDGAGTGEHVRATQRSDTAVLISVAGVSVGCIRRALAIGADGIVLRHIETGSGLQTAVKQVLDYTRAMPGVAATPLLKAVVESSMHAQDFGDLLDVEGVDAFLLEKLPSPGADDAVLEKVRGSGRAVGIIAASEKMLPVCRENDFWLIALGVDRAIIGDGIRDALGHACPRSDPAQVRAAAAES